jgi:ribonucleotide monophosphatase NagD (HAD superfamily)
MVFGRRNKMGTLLVLSGVTNSEDLRALKRGDGYGGDKSPDQVPHYFADSLKDLLKVKKAEGAK